jgi:hypothetical protein
MQVKLLMQWDIKPGRDQEYFEFVVKEFAPAIAKLGLRPTEAWFTLYGKSPQIMMGGIAQDLSSIKAMLSTQDWKELHDRLLEYVTNYTQKVVRFSPGFQL